MKHVLSKAGVSVPKTHDIAKLVELVSNCTVENEVSTGVAKLVPASRIRGIAVTDDYSNATLGNLFEAEDFGASKFPNEIRYGHTLKHFPASVMQQASVQLISWVKRYASSIQA